jgi:hypothetical protein
MLASEALVLVIWDKSSALYFTQRLQTSDRLSAFIDC